MAKATSCTACGDHGGALAHLDAAIHLLSSISPDVCTAPAAAISPLAACFSQRAACHREMGNPQAAISDLGRAIAILQPLDGAATLQSGFGHASTACETVASAVVALLTARGALLEQVEQHKASLADFEAVLRLEAANATAMAAAARLRRAQTGKSCASTTGRQLNAAWKSVPRPGMRVFENRGKAGAAF